MYNQPTPSSELAEGISLVRSEGLKAESRNPGGFRVIDFLDAEDLNNGTE